MFNKSTFVAIASLLLASSASFATESQSSRTVTIRGGQGDVSTVVIPANGQREAQPYQLTGNGQASQSKTITLRTGQGGFVQVPQR
ncbi:hypothetical protein [Humisphaera borealis]|uniref:Uncharacterized protein n=1 Tax=Humisphaera borealis TaxID=2807512 RepID=A0A7M2WYF7_9BACT|nr:hypothetical protein [Humisphaera borealis]QOV90443.1 hypothetical protein IPV69_03490 [Humisphaera borealis]